MITLASVLDVGLTRKVVHNYLRNILENFENVGITIPVDTHFLPVSRICLSAKPETQRWNFSTILIIKLASVLTTKVVTHEII